MPATGSSTHGRVVGHGPRSGEIADIPLVLVINRPYDSIEKKITKDRDRNAFGDKIMRMFFNHFARFGVKQNVRAAEMIVARASQCWSNGHTLLSELAAAVMYPDWSSATGRRIFGAGYFARSTSNLPAERLAFETLEKQWRDQEKVCLLQYFSSFGLLNAKRFTEDLHAKALKDAKRGNRMAPTRGEAEAIQLLLGIMRDLAPVLTAVFDHGDTTYTVAKTDALLGELKQGRTYRDRAVFLGADVFLLDFSEALSTFLHEHAHIFGHDGHRGFSDSLTELLEVVIRHRHTMDGYEFQWIAVRDKVAQERLGKEESPVNSVADWLAGMNEEALRDVLAQVPPVVLRQLRTNGGEASPA